MRSMSRPLHDNKNLHALVPQQQSSTCAVGRLSPIDQLIKADDKPALEAALHRGLDVNAQDETGTTVLEMAARWGSAQAMTLFLAAGADPEARSPGSTCTALHWAIADADIRMVNVLMKGGADLDSRDMFNRTPLFEVMPRAVSKVRNPRLRAGITAHAHDCLRQQRASPAATRRRLRIAYKLIQAGADVNAGDYEGFRPLHEAARTRHTELVRALLRAGADVNATTGPHAWTPLHLATAYDLPANVEALVEAHAGLTAREQRGETALHWALADGLLEVAEVLLKKAPELLPATIRALPSEDWKPTLHTLQNLSRAGTRYLTGNDLLEFLASESPAIRAAAFRLLGKLGNDVTASG